MPKSTMRGTGLRIDHPDGHAELVVQIEINCEAGCGQYSVLFAGHHLRAIRDLLVEMIDLHPELTGKDSDVQTLKRERWGGRSPSDPTVN